MGRRSWRLSDRLSLSLLLEVAAAAATTAVAGWWWWRSWINVVASHIKKWKKGAEDKERSGCLIIIIFFFFNPPVFSISFLRLFCNPTKVSQSSKEGTDRPSVRRLTSRKGRTGRATSCAFAFSCYSVNDWASDRWLGLLPLKARGHMKEAKEKNPFNSPCSQSFIRTPRHWARYPYLSLVLPAGTE